MSTFALPPLSTDKDLHMWTFALLAVVLFVGPRHTGLPGSAEAALVDHSQVTGRSWADSLPFARLPGPRVSAPWTELLVPILTDVASVLAPTYLLERE